MSAGEPPSATALFEQGVQHLASDPARAESLFRQAICADPALAAAHANLGYLLDRRQQATDAEASYRQALTLDRRQFETLLNLGGLLTRQKRFGEAEQIARQALLQRAESPAAWSNLGVLQACRQRERDAEQCYRTALGLAPDHPGAAFNLAYLLLRQGRWEEGWSRLEARPQPRLQVQAPRWQGEDLAGKSLLVGCEGGQGDMLMLARYLPLLKARGARLGLLCHPPLKTLFAGQPWADRVYGYDEDFPPAGWDYWTLPMSLPGLFDTRPDSVPAPLPYLVPDPALARHWHETLPAAPLRVGLVWRGNPGFENDLDRSLPDLGTLAPLAGLPGVLFVSLQKGAGEADPPPAGLTLHNPAPQLHDFADTAALVSQLDLVISVDTAVAHLAGALGTPCWLLLPDYKTDWRWLTGRDDTPWYPQVMRLFRQPPGGGWAPVLERVRQALAAWVLESALPDPGTALK